MYVCVRNLLTSGRASIHSVYLCSLFLYAQIVNFARGARERKRIERARSCTGCCLFTPRATTTTNLDYLLSRDRNRFSNTHYSHCLALCRRRRDYFQRVNIGTRISSFYPHVRSFEFRLRLHVDATRKLMAKQTSICYQSFNNMRRSDVRNCSVYLRLMYYRIR